MTKSRETVQRFYGLVCQGGSIQSSAEAVGVSRTRATVFWRRAAPMGLEVAMGRAGGLEGWRALRRLWLGLLRRRGMRRCADVELTSEDRAVIAAVVQQGFSYQQIGDLFGRQKSVVCREAHRNAGLDQSYWAPLAHRVAHKRRRRPKAFTLVEQPGLCRQIQEWMDQGRSPKLIASMLAADHPPGSIGRVSHETIYQALYVQTRGALRADLHKQLSLRRSYRKARGGAPRAGASPYRDAFKISQRPAEVEDRAARALGGRPHTRNWQRVSGGHAGGTDNSIHDLVASARPARRRKRR